jgi:hypothetical protein
MEVPGSRVVAYACGWWPATARLLPFLNVQQVILVLLERLGVCLISAPPDAASDADRLYSILVLQTMRLVKHLRIEMSEVEIGLLVSGSG